MRLDIGSGGPRGDGDWLGVDRYVPTADVQTDMWHLPYDANTVDEIFTSHALEHIGKFDIPPTLAEWHRVLKPGGKLTIRVPNLEWCCRHWLEHQTSIGWDLDVIFGNQTHPGEFHKTGFTAQTLHDYVVAAGFTITKQETLQTHSQETLSIEATK